MARGIIALLWSENRVIQPLLGSRITLAKMSWHGLAKIIAPPNLQTYYSLLFHHHGGHPVDLDNSKVLNVYRHLQPKYLGPQKVDKMQPDSGFEKIRAGAEALPILARVAGKRRLRLDGLGFRRPECARSERPIDMAQGGHSGHTYFSDHWIRAPALILCASCTHTKNEKA